MVIEFAVHLLAELDIHQTRTRVGLAVFNDEAEVVVHLDEYTSKADVIKVN